MKINKRMIKEAIKDSLLEIDEPDALTRDRERRIASGELKRQYFVVYVFDEYPEGEYGMANQNAFIAKDHATAKKIKREAEEENMIAFIFDGIEIE